MFKHILCAVDGSEHALKAAITASELAARLGSALTFLTVTKELQLTDEIRHYMEIEHLTGSPQYVLDEMTDRVLSEAKEQAIEHGVPNARTEVRTGPAARTIVAYAERNGVDLIVLGSRGLGDITGLLLGSVSHKVMSLAKCACLMVR